jgi:protein-arginine kinase activator protein McsA
MSECQVRWCRSGKPAEVPVTENIDDGAFRAVICQPCASAIGVQAGDNLPEPEVCRVRVEGAQS